MATQRAAAPLPALTSAHQQQLQHLIETLATNDQVAEVDVALLKHLVADLPRFRSNLPAETREALQELDQNEIALNGALAGLHETAQAFQQDSEGGRLAAPHLLDVAFINDLSRQAHALSQAAAELALRAQQRVELLNRYHDCNGR